MHKESTSSDMQQPDNPRKPKEVHMFNSLYVDANILAGTCMPGLYTLPLVWSAGFESTTSCRSSST